MSFKESFPTEESVHQNIKSQWGDFTEQIRAEIGHLEAAYKLIKKRRFGGGILFVVGVIIFSFLELAPNGFFILGALCAIGACFLFGYKLMLDKGGVISEFNSRLNIMVFTKVLSMFGIEGSHVTKTPLENVIKSFKQKRKPFFNIQTKLSNLISLEQKQVLDLLEHSELITEPRNRFVLDDMIHIVWNPGSLFVSELDIQHVTGSGKNRNVKKIFKGYFVSIDLKRKLEGKTFVSTEGDKNGFGHRSFWNNRKDLGATETELEWGQFEKLLHVASTDHTEARYVLTPNFMSDLYDWWKDMGEISACRLSILVYIFYFQTVELNLLIQYLRFRLMRCKITLKA